MSDNVLDIDDYREHVSVTNGNVAHVVSVQTIKKYINDECDLDRDLLNAIVKDWLECLLNGVE